MDPKMISSVLLVFVAFYGCVTSFAVSQMSCEFYNATCIKEALTIKERDVTEVKLLQSSNKKYYVPKITVHEVGSKFNFWHCCTPISEDFAFISCFNEYKFCGFSIEAHNMFALFCSATVSGSARATAPRRASLYGIIPV